MISVELGYLITKVNLFFLAALFVFGYKKERLNTSEIIIFVCVAVNYNFSQLLLETTDFYTFYLYFAAKALLVIVISLIIHLAMRVEHSNYTQLAYALLLTKFVLYMIVYRVRVVIYDSDKHIMWLINSQSMLVLFCDFLIIIVLFLKVSKWKLPYMRYS